MIVYMITNIINRKRYVGSTTRSLKRRKKDHLFESTKDTPKLYIHKAIKKYGISSFVWETLDVCDNIKQLYEMEYHYIKQYHSHVSEWGYNLTQGFDNSTFGLRFHYEDKERFMGANNSNYGRRWTDEQKKIISDLNTGRLIGDLNPAKRDDVRAKIKEGKMGDKNPNASKWLFITPEGQEIYFTGGVKRKMLELGLNYSGSKKHRDGLVDNYKGWIIKKL